MVSSMLIQYIKPSGILALYIKYYWVLEIDASEGEVCERVVPTGNIELMFHYKRPFICRQEEKNGAQPRSIISGIAGGFSDVATDGDAGVIAVTFYPFGACNFFSFPLIEIENAGINLCDIDRSNGKRLEEQVGAARTTRERVAAIEQYLMERFAPVDGDDLRFLRTSISIVNSHRGRIAAAELSGMVYLTGRSLERKFSHLIGKTPKQFIRIVRFQNVVSHLSAAGEESLSALALENGYFDQAHFIRDFKALAGYTPKEFLKLGPCGSDYFN